MAPPDDSASSELLGHTRPRLFTPPLVEGPPGPCGCGCALTPETSYGFSVIRFADALLGLPLDPWERLLVIHAGELLPDGRPRFRQVLVLVARQNGKTTVLKVLALYWLFIERWPLILGTSNKLEYAKEAWQGAVDLAKKQRVFASRINRVLTGNNDVHMSTTDDCKYKIAAANDDAGRSLTVYRWIADEIRKLRDWDAYNAAYNAMNAVPEAQAFMISNAGDMNSVVLNSKRKAALQRTDIRLGLFEWSAPDGCDVLDEQGWAAANPNLGRRLDVDTVRSAAINAKENGGKEERGFRTEVLCQNVPVLDAAVDPNAWRDSTIEAGDLSGHRGRVTVCLDVAPDGQHATLCAAAVVRPGVARVVVAKAWSGVGCTQQVRDELPALLKTIRPRSLGWLPGGPAAELAADFTPRKRQTSTGTPSRGTVPGVPRGTFVAAIKGEKSAVCMGFAGRVLAGGVEHLADQLLEAHVTSAERLGSGDTWCFSRKGGHVDAAYAAAGAVHLAFTLPKPQSRAVHMSSAVRAELESMRDE